MNAKPIYSVMQPQRKCVGRNTIIFNHYLDRLNEIRNRTAHGGRIYNRTFRSVTGVGKYQIFRMGIDNHKAMDVYLFLLNLLNQLDRHSDIHEFINDHIKRLFSTFKRNCITNRESNSKIEKVVFLKSLKVHILGD